MLSKKQRKKSNICHFVDFFFFLLWWYNFNVYRNSLDLIYIISNIKYRYNILNSDTNLKSNDFQWTFYYYWFEYRCKLCLKKRRSIYFERFSARRHIDGSLSRLIYHLKLKLHPQLGSAESLNQNHLSFLCLVRNVYSMWMDHRAVPCRAEHVPSLWTTCSWFPYRKSIRFPPVPFSVTLTHTHSHWPRVQR